MHSLARCVHLGVIKPLNPALCLMGDHIVCCRLVFKNGIKSFCSPGFDLYAPTSTKLHSSPQATHTHVFLFLLIFHHAVKWDYTTVDLNLSHLLQRTLLKALPWFLLRDGAAA